MPNRLFDWHEHIKNVELEYRAVRIAVDRLQAAVHASPDLLAKHGKDLGRLRDADGNLEGTYLVRLFAVFEAALRSYDRARHGDPTRNEAASVLIDVTAGRRGQGILRPFVRARTTSARPATTGRTKPARPASP